MSATTRLIGIDVGSTTVKAVLMSDEGDDVLWRAYTRHETRQAETLHGMLAALERETGVTPADCRAYVTGSGGDALAEALGARYVQEVHAVSLAVEALYPDASSVVELGGQDAKVIVFGDGGPDGRRRKIPSMNDRCAGGTGAVIDKIAAKLGLDGAALASLGYESLTLHPVAAKCGVFAETDINGLQKLGVSPAELMASLFDAIVVQNLAVLTRGHTLRPRVLLLGGPNTFFPGLRDAWRANIPRVWQERQVTLPPGLGPADLITVPPDAQYFGAIGAVHYGRHEDLSPRSYAGARGLGGHVDGSRDQRERRHGAPGLVSSREELHAFARRYAPAAFVPPALTPGAALPAFLGVDGGSTSTKGVALAPSGEVICKAYRLSKGNPVEDTIQVLGELHAQVASQGASLDVLGFGTTGYARTLLRDVFRADLALVETVAHAEAARRFCDDPEVIVDVGGQDIKLIVLRDGRIADFKLNTQCSAGNGFFLQATAESFGIRVEDYAEAAFSARSMPVFGYGCAVFLQTDIVNLQRLGWRAPEILAGLAAVLPKNVFLYVAKAPNLSRLGRRFVLQGATQRNLAVVKAEVDFIEASFAGTGVAPHVVVHQHCGEGGAIGAALEAIRLHQPGRASTFIGFEAAARVAFTTRRGEDTRCRFCKNTCLRTFIDVEDGLHSRRVIVASCEKGEADSLSDMRGIKADVDRVKAANPNLVEAASREAWAPTRPPRVLPPPPRTGLVARFSGRADAAADRVAARAAVRIGMPRALHHYNYGPLFSTYFESLGVDPLHLVYSDFTSTDLYRAGCSRGSIDPCFPSKVALSHVHNLLWMKHRQAPLDFIFFPMCDVLRSPLVGARACNGCPTATITPDTIRAAFNKEHDVFAEHGITYVNPMLDLSDRRLFAFQMYEAWAAALRVGARENAAAVDAAFRAQDAWEASLRRRGREVLDRLVAEERLGIVLLGRAYHHDEGLNHGIPEALQKRGYPILSQGTLPMDEDLLDELFGDEVRAGVIADPLDVSDVWKNTTSASTNTKLWAAKFTARHPNLVGIELSSFKCGHDAPVYSVIEEIFASAGKPFFAFRDLDENKATGSIALRVDTIDYFLRRHCEALVAVGRVRAEIARQLGALERHWREDHRAAGEVPHDDALAG